MIIAIDESGDFRKNSSSFHFFSGISIRQQSDLYNTKKNQFFKWEQGLSRELKNHKGEIKSSALSESELSTFVDNVLLEDPYVRIAPISFKPSENPPELIEKYKVSQLASINDGVLVYSKQGKTELVRTYKDFANWFRNLSYPQYIRIFLLGYCIVKSLGNTMGHAIVQGYDHELIDLRFLLDEGYIKGREQNTFWHEILRNQLYSFSKVEEIPLPIEWKKTGHPFFDKYYKKGYMDFNELFMKNCQFVSSSNSFEIRIADAVNSILRKYFNNGEWKNLYDKMKYCFMKDGRVTHIILNEINLEEYSANQDSNPWESLNLDKSNRSQ